MLLGGTGGGEESLNKWQYIIALIQNWSFSSTCIYLLIWLLTQKRLFIPVHDNNRWLQVWDPLLHSSGKGLCKWHALILPPVPTPVCIHWFLHHCTQDSAGFKQQMTCSSYKYGLSLHWTDIKTSTGVEKLSLREQSVFSDMTLWHFTTASTAHQIYRNNTCLYTEMSNIQHPYTCHFFHFCAICMLAWF